MAGIRGTAPSASGQDRRRSEAGRSRVLPCQRGAELKRIPEGVEFSAERRVGWPERQRRPVDAMPRSRRRTVLVRRNGRAVLRRPSRGSEARP